jgi:hypothetical protein
VAVKIMEVREEVTGASSVVADAGGGLGSGGSGGNAPLVEALLARSLAHPSVVSFPAAWGSVAGKLRHWELADPSACSGF